MKTRNLLAVVALALLPACVVVKAPGFAYGRLGSVKARGIDVNLGTNSVHLRGYQSDGEAMAGSIAEGVARGLKK